MERLLAIKKENPDWGLKELSDLLQKEFGISKSKSRKLVKDMNKPIGSASAPPAGASSSGHHSKRFSSPVDGSVSVGPRPVANMNPRGT